MYDQKYFRKLQKQFLKDHTKEVETQGTQVLSCAFHPILNVEPQSEFQYIVLLEQIFYPDGYQVAEMAERNSEEETKQELGQYRAASVGEYTQKVEHQIYTINGSYKDDQDASSYQLVQETMKAKDKTIEQEDISKSKINIQFEYRSQSTIENIVRIDFKKAETQREISNEKSFKGARGNNAVSFNEKKSQKMQKSRTQLLSTLLESNASLVTDDCEDTSKQIKVNHSTSVFSQPVNLAPIRTVLHNEDESLFRLSIKKVSSDSQEYELVAQQEISFAQQFQILKNKISFSNDGQILFVIVTSLTGKILNILAFNSTYLSKFDQGQICIDKFNFNGKYGLTNSLVANLTGSPKFILNPKSNKTSKLDNYIVQILCLIYSFIQHNLEAFFIQNGQVRLAIPMISTQTLKQQYEIKKIVFTYSKQPTLTSSHSSQGHQWLDKIIFVIQYLQFETKEALEVVEHSLTQLIERQEAKFELNPLDCESIYQQQIQLGFQATLIEKIKAFRNISDPDEVYLLIQNAETRVNKNHGHRQHQNCLVILKNGKQQLPSLPITKDKTKEERKESENQFILELMKNNDTFKPRYQVIPLKFEAKLGKYPQFQEDPPLFLLNESLKSYFSLTFKDLKAKYSIDKDDMHDDVQVANKLDFDEKKLVQIDGQVETENADIFDLKIQREGLVKTLGSYTQDSQVNNVVLTEYNDQEYSRITLEFIGFVELINGKLEVNDITYYRHQVFVFATLDQENDKISLNILKLPSYDDGILADEDKAIRVINNEMMYHQLQRTYKIHWPREQGSEDSILKICLGQIQQFIRQKKTFLIIQTRSYIQIRDLEKRHALEEISTGSSPLLFTQSLQITPQEESNPISLVFSTYLDKQNEVLQSFSIGYNTNSSLKDIYQVKNKRFVKVRLLGSKLLALDDSAIMRVFRYSEKSDNYDLQNELRFTEDIKTQLGQGVELSEAGVYAGGCFYLGLENTQGKLSESQLDFENRRTKQIGQLSSSSLIDGPTLSVDQSRLLYVKVKQLTKEAQRIQEEGKIQIRDSKKVRNIASTRFSTSRNTIRFSLKNKLNPLGKRQKSQGQFQAIYFQVINMPLIMEQQVQLMHQDCFQSEKIQSTTFTLYNGDVLCITQNNLFILTKFGNPQSIEIEDKLTQVLSEIFRVHQIKMLRENSGLAILISTSTNYYVVAIDYDRSAYSASIMYERPVKAEHNFSELIYINQRLDDQGVLYELQIAKDTRSEEIFVEFLKQDETKEILSQMILRLYEAEDNKVQEELAGKAKKKKKNKSVNIENQSALLAPSIDIDFQLISPNYLVLKFNLSLYYIDLGASNKGNEQFTPVNLTLRQGKITQLLQTEKENTLQIVYNQLMPTLNCYVFLWDLKQNMELSVQELPLKSESDSIKLYKGVSEKLNYFIPVRDSYIHDLRYCFPNNIYSGKLAYQERTKRKQDKDSNDRDDDQRDLTRGTQLIKQRMIMKILRSKAKQVDEIKVSENGQEVMGISQTMCTSLQLPYSYLQLNYLEYLMEFFRTNNINNTDDDTFDKSLILPLLKVQMKNCDNILHIFAINSSFILQFQREVELNLKELNDESYRDYVYYSLMLNNSMLNPFNIALSEFVPKSFEAILEMLSDLQNQDLLYYIRSHLFQLMELKSKNFEKFIENCSSVCVLKVRSTWNYNQNVKYFPCKSMYMTEQNIQAGVVLNIKDAFQDKEQKKELEILITNMQTSNFGVLPTKTKDASELYDDNLKQPLQDSLLLADPTFFIQKGDQPNQKRQVTFFAYQLGWLLRGDSGEQFTNYMRKQKRDSPLFNMKLIQTLIDCQWNFFKRQFVKYQLIPYCMFMLFLIIYTTLRNENLFIAPDLKELSRETQSNLNITHEVFGAAMSLLALYFIFFEYKKVKKTHTFFGYIQLIFHIFVIIVFIVDAQHIPAGVWRDEKPMDSFDDTRIDIFLITSAIMTIWGYFLLLLQLRIFETTAKVINLVQYVFREGYIFFFFFLFMAMAFGNTFFILAKLQRDTIESPRDQLTGKNLFTAFIFGYWAALGEFRTDLYDGLNNYQEIYYCVFVVQTLISMVAFLNLCIAVLGDIYTRVTENQKTERFKAKCDLITENEFIFPRDKLFKDSKYIIRVEVDRGETLDVNESNWNGIVNSVTKVFKRHIAEEQQQTDKNFKFIKSKLKTFNGQINDFQNHTQEQLEELKQNVENLMTLVSQNPQFANAQVVQQHAPPIYHKQGTQAISESQGDFNTESEDEPLVFSKDDRPMSIVQEQPESEERIPTQGHGGSINRSQRPSQRSTSVKFQIRSDSDQINESL